MNQSFIDEANRLMPLAASLEIKSFVLETEYELPGGRVWRVTPAGGPTGSGKTPEAALRNAIKVQPVSE